MSDPKQCRRLDQVFCKVLSESCQKVTRCRASFKFWEWVAQQLKATDRSAQLGSFFIKQ